MKKEIIIGICMLVMLVGCSKDYDTSCLDELANFECNRNGYRTGEGEISLKGFLSSPFIICPISSSKSRLIDLNETDVSVCNITNISIERYKIIESRWLPDKCYNGDTFEINNRDDWICCHKSTDGGTYSYNLTVNGENRTLDLLGHGSITCDEYDQIDNYWNQFNCRYSIGECEQLQREYESTGKIYVPFLQASYSCNDIRNTLKFPFIPDCNTTGA